MTTWTPLQSGNSAGDAVAYGACPDITTGLLKSRGDVAMFDDFADGSLSGWAPNMWDYHTPVTGPTLTTYPVASGAYAMALVLRDAPFAARASDSKPVIGGTVTACKRLVNYQQSGHKSISLKAALGSEGSADEPAWGGFLFGMDIQRQDNTTRGFFKARCDYIEPDSTYPYGHTVWRICNNSGVFVDVPGSEFALTGENENKQGFNYLRLTIDDTGTGSYTELQVNSQVFDLRSLGAGRGSQAPQAGGWMADYRGGLNPLVAIDQRKVGGAVAAYPGNADTGQLIVDQVCVTFNDKVVG